MTWLVPPIVAFVFVPANRRARSLLGDLRRLSVDLASSQFPIVEEFLCLPREVLDCCLFPKEVFTRQHRCPDG